jgi:hypothetical protein
MAGLPADIARLLDGSDLETRVGITLLVISTGEDGWPRAATLSVGEVLAPNADEILLSLYATSRTTAAITSSGRAMLLLTHKGSIVRVMLEASGVTDPAADAAGRRTFRARVADVEVDAVAYARVTHGIEFELLDHGEAMSRWAGQLAELREVAAR